MKTLTNGVNDELGYRRHQLPEPQTYSLLEVQIPDSANQANQGYNAPKIPYEVENRSMPVSMAEQDSIS